MAELIKFSAHGHTFDEARRLGHRKDSTDGVLAAKTSQLEKLQRIRRREDGELFFQQQTALELQDQVKPFLFVLRAFVHSWVGLGHEVALWTGGLRRLRAGCKNDFRRKPASVCRFPLGYKTVEIFAACASRHVFSRIPPKGCGAFPLLWPGSTFGSLCFGFFVGDSAGKTCLLLTIFHPGHAAAPSPPAHTAAAAKTTATHVAAATSEDLASPAPSADPWDPPRKIPRVSEGWAPPEHPSNLALSSPGQMGTCPVCGYATALWQARHEKRRDSLL